MYLSNITFRIYSKKLILSSLSSGIKSLSSLNRSSPSSLSSIHPPILSSSSYNNSSIRYTSSNTNDTTNNSTSSSDTSSFDSSIPKSTPLPQNSSKILLSKQDDQPTNILSYDKYGFNINNIHMRGSILAFNNFTLLWNMQHIVNITPRSLAIVHMIHPKPQILLIGTGDNQININPSLYGYFSRKGIAVEAMTNAHVISTFNVLVAEGRPVCAALVSQTPVSRDDACLYTPDVQLMETEKDRKIIETLAQDLLPRDRNKLLTDGKIDNINNNTIAKNDSEQSPKESSSTTNTDINNIMSRKVDIQSEIIATKYGYPGALPPDISPIRNIDKDANTIRERVRANRADRRSSSKK